MQLRWVVVLNFCICRFPSGSTPVSVVGCSHGSATTPDADADTYVDIARPPQNFVCTAAREFEVTLRFVDRTCIMESETDGKWGCRRLRWRAAHENLIDSFCGSGAEALSPLRLSECVT